MKEQPMQPIYRDDLGTIRFQRNAIVSHLLYAGEIGLDQLAKLKVPQADREQFYQLIGYSLSGYHELSDVSDDSALLASGLARMRLGIQGVIGCRDNGCEIDSGVEREGGPK